MKFDFFEIKIIKRKEIFYERINKRTKKALKIFLQAKLENKAEYHEDLSPSADMTLDDLMELYFYWGEKYNDKYIPEQTHKDTISVFLTENFEQYLNGDKFEKQSSSVNEVFISRELLISELSGLPEQERLELIGVYDLIKSLPSKKEKTESNSYWVEQTDLGMPVGAICSNCGGWIAYDVDGHYDLAKNKFCYHCGHKMAQRDPEWEKKQALEDIQKELKNMGDCPFSAAAINNIFETSVVQEHLFVNKQKINKEVVIKALLEVVQNANK
ncbi:MAG: hypothetical protein ACI37Z_04980 [Candidatus Gastranaerophilaceae bacterium]